MPKPSLTAVLTPIPRLVHTGVSDDADVTVTALRPQGGGRFVCLSAHGAGEAALTLAACGADQVLAVDLEDEGALDQLLHLKVTAARIMGREDYLAVMGLRRASPLRRGALADQLLRALPEPHRTWWRARRRWLVRGLFYADRQTAFFDAWLWASRRLMPEPAYETMLFGAEREARVQAFRAHLRRPVLLETLDRLGARLNLFFPASEWAASEYPRALNRDPLRYLESLVATGLSDNPVFAHLVRQRHAPLPEPLQPAHLRPAQYAGLTGAHARIKTVPRSPERGPLGGVLDGLTGAYLSNIIDYLDEPARRTLLSQLVARLEPGAPVLIYSNEAYEKVPAECGLQLDLQASEQVATEDRAHIYLRRQVFRAPGARADKKAAIPRLRVVD